MIICQKCQTEITKEDELEANYREIKEGPNYGKYQHLRCPGGETFAEKQLREIKRVVSSNKGTAEANPSSWIVK